MEMYLKTKSEGGCLATISYMIIHGHMHSSLNSLRVKKTCTLLTAKLKCFVLKNMRVLSNTWGEWAPNCLLSQRCSSSMRVTICPGITSNNYMRKESKQILTVVSYRGSIVIFLRTITTMTSFDNYILPKNNKLCYSKSAEIQWKQSE